MLRTTLYLFVLVIMCQVMLLPELALACPTCFGSVSKHVLNTYYLSALFLSLLPFGVIAMIVLVVRSSSSNNANPPNAD